MRKKLVLLAFALAAVAASSTIAPASAASATCPKNTHEFTCGGVTTCCPNNALCLCGA